VGSAELGRARDAPQALAALLDGLLDRMAGNLGPSLTFAEVAPGGGRRFVRVSLPPSTRAEAVLALNSVRHVGPAAAEAALAALRARHPRAVHPLTYLGELYLWLGRYREAFGAFLAAHRIEPARWASIGMLAVLVLTGRARLARLMASHATTTFPPIPGSTLPVYRGILRRRTGDLGGAVEDLRAALAAKPTRIGARMELCLALRAAGGRDRPRSCADPGGRRRGARPRVADRPGFAAGRRSAREGARGDARQPLVIDRDLDRPRR
jgi:tetratricopeptide (TPR) repeat protein